MRCWNFSLPIVLLGMQASMMLGTCGRPVVPASDVKDGMKLVWADEFDGSGLPDSTKWSYDVGDGCPNLCGWGNNELQYYTDARVENARLENGHLVIEARREPWANRAYTSARLVSKHKGDWTYGRVDIRLKVAEGLGTWSAAWMLPTDWAYGGWPKSGEIDIMEQVGYSPDSVFGTVHTEAFNHIAGTQVGKGLHDTTLSSRFHTYSIVWDEERIQFLMDDKPYHTFNNKREGSAAWPFDKDFHMILNLAVGGNWGGRKGVDETIWPRQMLIDYVRVYQAPGDSKSP